VLLKLNSPDNVFLYGDVIRVIYPYSEENKHKGDGNIVNDIRQIEHALGKGIESVEN